jgi:hypothetical protein
MVVGMWLLQADVGVDPGEFSRMLMRSARKICELEAERPLEPVQVLEEAYEQTKEIIGARLDRKRGAIPHFCTSSFHGFWPCRCASCEQNSAAPVTHACLLACQLYCLIPAMHIDVCRHLG